MARPRMMTPPGAKGPPPPKGKVVAKLPPAHKPIPPKAVPKPMPKAMPKAMPPMRGGAPAAPAVPAGDPSQTGDPLDEQDAAGASPDDSGGGDSSSPMDQGQPPGQDPLQPPGDPTPAGQPETMADGQLDTADSASQPQIANAGDSDANVFATMVAGLRKYIFGPGENGIMQALRGAPPDGLWRVLGEVVYSLMREAVKQAQQTGHDLSMDLVLGVATEVIDDIAELADAQNVDVTDKDKQGALFYAQQIYVESQKPSNDQRNAAKQQLAQFKQDGAVDTAVSYVQQQGQEAGADPFGVSQMKQRPGMMGGGGNG